MTAEKLTNASPESASHEIKQANRQNVVTNTSLNLAKRLVQAKEPSTAYNEAIKKEEL